MNILILTQIHPVTIVQMNWIYKYSNCANIFSVQAMALLAEETLNKNYLTSNQIFTYELIKNSNLPITKNKNRKYTIIYGNLDKRTDIKFDHIILYPLNCDLNENEIKNQPDLFDPYLQEYVKVWNEVDKVSDHEYAKLPQYYTVNDTHITLHTQHHIEVFLKSLGLEENKGEDE